MSNLKTRLKRLEQANGKQADNLPLVLIKDTNGRLITPSGAEISEKDADNYRGLVIELCRDDV